MFPNGKLLFCSRCKIEAYCTKDCQRKAWKIHKPICVPIDPNDGGHQSIKAINTLFDLFTRHPDEKLFSTDKDSDQGTAAATRRTKKVVDLASIAKDQYDHHGPGVLLISFKDREECEDCAVKFALCLRGTLRGNCLPLPRMVYELWPLDRPGPRVLNAAPILRAISIESIMKHMSTDHFALCMTIPSTSEGVADGATQAMLIPHTNPRSTGFKRISAPVTASRLSKDFSQRLSSGEEFQECRMNTRQFKQVLVFCGYGTFLA